AIGGGSIGRWWSKGTASPTSRTTSGRSGSAPTGRTSRRASVETARSDDRRGVGHLPTFFVIGAMKAGTESLWQYLRRHPQVFMTEVKEPDYFAEELNWSRGLRWYTELFREAGIALAVGEASTSYSKFPTH